MTATRREQTRAIQRRGVHGRLAVALAKLRNWRDDPGQEAQYQQALADMAALEAEMRRAGQEP